MSVPSRAVLAALVALYVLLFPYHPGLRSPNELCRLWQTRALVEYGTLDINRALRDFGYVGDLSVKDGKYYPSKAPLLSFAAVPVYGVLRAAGGGTLRAVGEVPLVFFSRLLLTVLPTLLLLGLVRRFLGAYVSAGVADAVTVTYGLGSLAFSYSLLFMSHQTTAVLLFGGFYALWRVARDEWKPWGYLVAGACAGATLAAEYTGGLGVLGLVLYAALSVLWREEPPRARARRLLQGAGLTVLGALPFVVGLMLYHQAAFGHPLETGYKHLNDAAYQPWHLGGFLGIRYPDPRAFALSFFSPLRGLFTLSPFLLLALPGLGVLGREARTRPEMRAHLWLTVALLLGYTYFTSSFSYDSWGWTTGPRHLTGLVPFLLLPVGLLLERARSAQRKAWAGVAAALCTASIVFTGLATFVNYVPDDVSNAVLGLAMPLLRAGYVPPNVLNLLGLPNPVAGLALGLVLLGVALWVFVRLASIGERPGRAPLLAGLAAFAVLLGFQAVTVRHDAPDQGAVNLLEKVWLVPPGRTLSF
ncbi:hypothetical protein CYFUS_001383 [Cystobacter fuscus]|uniref:Glycosyltransferase RgtA/B/C/D-like domain-containing protein n=1 Tax=Cystobacter fuscus TaxID=43 RepID=A0A250IW60_9BACT|nr:hypothetical protein [Cystobacter fuscus]ATB35969.1 hypothetical protein CYFUS_001383 [Cystobacter fuscus]